MILGCLLLNLLICLDCFLSTASAVESTARKESFFESSTQTQTFAKHSSDLSDFTTIQRSIWTKHDVDKSNLIRLRRLRSDVVSSTFAATTSTTTTTTSLAHIYSTSDIFDYVDDAFNMSFQDYNSSSNSTTRPTSASDIALKIVLSIVFIPIIISTLLGNMLIILAVVIVKKLHTQDNANNFLIVSLAVSDFLVGVLAMPFALYVELSEDNKWELGAVLCDLWTMFDVLLCTASILNLFAISVDRYFIILHAMVYTQRRNAKLMLLMIFIVWATSAIISIPPLFGWGKPSANLKLHGSGRCSVSNDLRYQIYATLLAFYLPLIAMIIIYLNIYRAARKIKKREMETSGRIQAAMSPLSSDSLHHLKRQAKKTSFYDTNDDMESSFHGQRESIKLNALGRLRNKLSVTKRKNSKYENTNSNVVASDFGSNEAPKTHGNHAHTQCHSSISSQGTDHSREQHRLSVNLLAAKSSNNDTSVQALHNSSSSSRRGSFGRKFGRRLTHAFSGIKRYSGPNNAHGKNKKATRTLGVIMGCFILCWLPFFIMALIKPIDLANGQKVSDVIPKWFDSLLLWLGYFNSALNPLIYVRFNREFRRPFIEILCFRCKGINKKLREEQRKRMYIEDYESMKQQRRTSTMHPTNIFGDTYSHAHTTYAIHEVEVNQDQAVQPTTTNALSSQSDKIDGISGVDDVTSKLLSTDESKESVGRERRKSSEEIHRQMNHMRRQFYNINDDEDASPDVSEAIDLNEIDDHDRAAQTFNELLNQRKELEKTGLGEYMDFKKIERLKELNFYKSSDDPVQESLNSKEKKETLNKSNMSVEYYVIKTSDDESASNTKNDLANNNKMYTSFESAKSFFEGSIQPSRSMPNYQDDNDIDNNNKKKKRQK